MTIKKGLHVVSKETKAEEIQPPVLSSLEELELPDNLPVEQIGVLVEQWAVESRNLARLREVSRLKRYLAKDYPKDQRKPLEDEAKEAEGKIPDTQKKMTYIRDRVTELLSGVPHLCQQVVIWQQVFPNLRYPVARGLKSKYNIDVDDILEKVAEIEKKATAT